MEPFMVYAIASGFFFAIFTFLAKYIISNRMRNFVSFVYMQGILIIGIFTFLTYIFAPKEVFVPPVAVFPYAIISGGTSIIAYLLMYYGLTRYDASSALPIIGVKPVFVIPLSYVFLGEYYGVDVTFWILVAMLGAVMTSWDDDMQITRILSPSNEALWIFLSTAFLYAAGNVAVKPAMKMVTNFNFLIWRELAWFGVLICLAPLIFHSEELKALKVGWRNSFLFVVLAVVVQYFSYLFLFYSLGHSVQITEGLGAAQGIFAVTIGYLISRTSFEALAEHHNSRTYLVRMIGAILIFLGIYFLSTVAVK
ncbi:DMT family transporter [Candidatus Bathyarchaeota archaeon]|nr:DMT family transporter [Candidatus Bathyarchaeota archaeon]MBS7628423.1 DMT family transporter [Candidatus Bathyarchaeota archaeon]